MPLCLPTIPLRDNLNYLGRCRRSLTQFLRVLDDLPPIGYGEFERHRYLAGFWHRYAARMTKVDRAASTTSAVRVFRCGRKTFKRVIASSRRMSGKETSVCLPMSYHLRVCCGTRPKINLRQETTCSHGFPAHRPHPAHADRLCAGLHP